MTSKDSKISILMSQGRSQSGDEQIPSLVTREQSQSRESGWILLDKKAAQEGGRSHLSYSRSRLSKAKLPLNCHELELELRMIINDRKGASHYGSIKCNVSLIDNTFFHGTFGFDPTEDNLSS